MDHLPVLRKPSSPVTRVPYVGTRRCSRGNATGYSRRLYGISKLGLTANDPDFGPYALGNHFSGGGAIAVCPDVVALFRQCKSGSKGYRRLVYDKVVEEQDGSKCITTRSLFADTQLSA